MEAICDTSPLRSPRGEQNVRVHSTAECLCSPLTLACLHSSSLRAYSLEICLLGPGGLGHDQSWTLISSNSLMKRPHCYKHTAPSLLEGSLRSQWSAICIKMLTWLQARHGHTGRAVTVLCPGLQRRSLTQLGSVWILWPEARVRNRPALALTVLHPVERSSGPWWLTSTSSQNICRHMSAISHRSTNEIADVNHRVVYLQKKWKRTMRLELCNVSKIEYCFWRSLYFDGVVA